jgi:hypothetical protein
MTDEKNVTRIRFEKLLTAILERVTRIELRLDAVSVDVDALDRFNRPYGDGTRLSAHRRRRT